MKFLRKPKGDPWLTHTHKHKCTQRHRCTPALMHTETHVPIMPIQMHTKKERLLVYHGIQFRDVSVTCDRRLLFMCYSCTLCVLCVWSMCCSGLWHPLTVLHLAVLYKLVNNATQYPEPPWFEGALGCLPINSTRKVKCVLECWRLYFWSHRTHYAKCKSWFWTLPCVVERERKKEGEGIREVL